MRPAPTRRPDCATYADDVADVARRADVVVLSLPDGTATYQVVRQILQTREHRATAGRGSIPPPSASPPPGPPTFSRPNSRCAFIDAPVSGGVAGARARTLAVMYAGADEAGAHARPAGTGRD